MSARFVPTEEIILIGLTPRCPVAARNAATTTGKARNVVAGDAASVVASDDPGQCHDAEDTRNVADGPIGPAAFIAAGGQRVHGVAMNVADRGVSPRDYLFNAPHHGPPTPRTPATTAR